MGDRKPEIIVVTKAHKIRLNPTPEQREYFWKAAGVARRCFNWGLEEYNRRLDEKEKVSGRLLKKEFNAIKADKFPFVSEVTTWAMQGAFDDLQRAFSNFFEKHKKGLLKPPPDWKGRKDGKPFGWPKKKQRYKSKPSFYLANAALRFDNHYFQFDKGRVGWINMVEPLRFDGKIMGGRISYQGGYWWLSVQVQVNHDIPMHNTDAVGIDLGIKYLATIGYGDSNIKSISNPRAFERKKRKLRRLNRSLARMEKGGKNWQKKKEEIARLHYQIACVRNEASHQMTTEISRDYGIIGIEDLNVRGMVKNRRLARAISDAAFYEKRRQLEYKSTWNGGIVVPVSRWFPSSKTCNICGWIKFDVKLSEREWECQECGSIHHRDGNAALNIRDEALRILLKK